MFKKLLTLLTIVSVMGVAVASDDARQPHPGDRDNRPLLAPPQGGSTRGGVYLERQGGRTYVDGQVAGTYTRGPNSISIGTTPGYHGHDYHLRLGRRFRAMTRLMLLEELGLLND